MGPQHVSNALQAVRADQSNVDVSVGPSQTLHRDQRAVPAARDRSLFADLQVGDHTSLPPPAAETSDVVARQRDDEQERERGLLGRHQHEWRERASQQPEGAEQAGQGTAHNGKKGTDTDRKFKNGRHFVNCDTRLHNNALAVGSDDAAPDPLQRRTVVHLLR